VDFGNPPGGSDSQSAGGVVLTGGSPRGSNYPGGRPLSGVNPVGFMGLSSSLSSGHPGGSPNPFRNTSVDRVASVVHPQGWNRWVAQGLPLGMAPTSGVAARTPEVFFWGTPRVGQGLTPVGSLSRGGSTPARAGGLLVWTPPPGVPRGSPLGGWLFRVGTLLGYF